MLEFASIDEFCNTTFDPSFVSLSRMLDAMALLIPHLKYKSLGINGLSGELPKELGNLTDLISFAFGANNFSGPLPSELGSLSKLKEM
ncbi:somatic embryogenesis receptor kinase 5-like isoform X2 [Malus sylvestris]|uniref:somatic embryogenesis receptor kinase 5-like isoform X2 n=1 Tax=Malus sylvestris TaxID=3752 RepID=UPI0021AC2EFD|nr:somatic embryogenesis receptor kinase 5-like isoform X2 [Malus sylvestris]